MPLPKAEKSFDLKEVGAPEYNVTFRTSAGLKYSDLMAQIERGKDLEGDQVTVFNFVERILAWNIPEVDNGPPMPIPSKDADSVNKLPHAFIEYILIQFKDDIAEGISNLALKNGIQ